MRELDHFLLQLPTPQILLCGSVPAASELILVTESHFELNAEMVIAASFEYSFPLHGQELGEHEDVIASTLAEQLRQQRILRPGTSTSLVDPTAAVSSNTLLTGEFLIRTSWLIPVNLVDTDFFLLIMLWSRHVKPSSAKGEKRLKRKKISKFVQAEALPESESYKSKDRCTGKRDRIPKFVQAEALPESEIMYKSKDRCTGMKDRITRDKEIQRYAKTYQKPSPQTSVHLEQQVELRKKVESGSTIADSEAA